VAYLILPFYIAIDIIREGGLQVKTASDVVTTSDVVSLGWILMGYGLAFHGPLLLTFRKSLWLSLVFFVSIPPWWFIAPLVTASTQNRGFLNTVAVFSLPVWHWLLSVVAFYLLRSWKIIL
jgi:hypothetical protein